jgi:hypothetical protein
MVEVTETSYTKSDGLMMVEVTETSYNKSDGLMMVEVTETSYNKSQQDALFLKFILIKGCTCFGQIYCPSSGVSTMYTQQ